MTLRDLSFYLGLVFESAASSRAFADSFLAAWREWIGATNTDFVKEIISLRGD
jgi:hypothetical protein